MLAQFAVPLGIAGMVQAAFLPGQLLLRGLRLELNLALMLGLSVVFSLPLNYALVGLLSALGLSLPPVWWAVMAAELALLLRLAARRHDQARAVPPAAATAGPAAPLARLAEWAALAGALLMLGRLFARLVRTVGTVFIEWDPALVWNLRATAWTGNAFPGFMYNYPDITPVTYAIPYLFMGSTALQYFSKALAPVFAVAMVLLLVGVWVRSRRLAYLVGAVATAALLRYILGIFLDHGYADTPVALLAIAAALLLAMAATAADPTVSRRMLWLAVFAAIATAHAKQVGLALAAAFPLLVYLVERDRGQRRAAAAATAGLVLLAIGIAVLPWYVAASRAMAAGGGSTMQFLTYLASGAHADSDLRAKLVGMLSYMRDRLGRSLSITLPLSILLTVLVDRFWRRMMLFVAVPFWLAWLVLFSYDPRNMAMALPFFGVAMGVAAEAVVRVADGHLPARLAAGLAALPAVPALAWPARGRLGAGAGAGTRLMAGALGIVLAVAASASPWVVERLAARHALLQRETGEAEVNAALYAIHAAAPGTVLTNYSILLHRLLPGLEEAPLFCLCTRPEELDEALDARRPSYVLLRLDTMPDRRVSDRLRALVREGRLVPRMEKTIGKQFVLYEVVP